MVIAGIRRIAWHRYFMSQKFLNSTYFLGMHPAFWKCTLYACRLEDSALETQLQKNV